MLVRKTAAVAMIASLCCLPLLGCESMNHSMSDKNASCCSDMGDKKMDTSKMSKADMSKCGDEMVAKGNAMKADAMKMDAGAKKDDTMKKADAMIKEGQMCQEKAAKM